jgi:MerR family copper efflux transcriptional regulator
VSDGSGPGKTSYFVLCTQASAKGFKFGESGGISRNPTPSFSRTEQNCFVNLVRPVSITASVCRFGQSARAWLAVRSNPRRRRMLFFAQSSYLDGWCPTSLRLVTDCLTFKECLVRLYNSSIGVHANRCGAIDMPRFAEYLTIKEAAKHLGISPNTLRNWDRDGKIPVHRHPISNYRLFKKEDLENVLRQIEASGEHLAGWEHPAGSARKPR